MNIFPVIDISYAIETYGTEEKASEEFGKDDKIESICNDMFNAFNQWGFIYLKGHGISQESIDNTFSVSKSYFQLPSSIKESTALKSGDPVNTFGYVPFKFETFEKEKAFDLKEAYDFQPWMPNEMRQKLPDDFIMMLDEMFRKGKHLSLIVLRLINKSLGLKDVSYLENAHQKMDKANGSVSIFRTLYYPAVNEEDVQLLQQRCGIHSDYGTITLLFQDDVGGLEVQSPTGEFVQATPVKDTLIMNAADFLDIWTGGRIKSAKHRVVLPKDMSKPRQSFAFFCKPDNDVVVSCLDGSDTYQPVRTLDYVKSQFEISYKQEKVQ